ncbi:MAG TPA: aldehyde dehydrogenase family protein [Roseiflexaceae bacterium]|nr:aldehyde dehydrogenase family protein [Roseiflexaceae bacterium]
MTHAMVPVLIAGEWRASRSVGEFQAENPTTGEVLAPRYPVSSREEVLAALEAGSAAAEALRTSSSAQIAQFLEQFAAAIEARRAELVALAHTESGLPATPRLQDVELPRTTDQLRQAALAAREGSWRRPIRDTARGIYSIYAPLGGPVVVMGRNSFPFAFNSSAGGDFAAAIAAHNPVIAKANTGHPGTTRLLTELAFEAVQAAGLHPATIQLIYRTPRDVGLELVSHPLVAATGFTGSRAAGLQLKAAADRAGKPIYLEMSSVNPVVLLEGALRQRGDAIATEFFGSCTMGAGQFCTNPGLVIVPDGAPGDAFVAAVMAQFSAATPGVLLGRGGREGLIEAVATLRANGDELLCGGEPLAGPGYRFANTLLSVSGAQFLAQPHALQTEAFGPVSLLVRSGDTAQTVAILQALEGNLTGTIYVADDGSDDAAYAVVEPPLRRRVGRLLNNKMPTGVAVSPAMNHGGPFPSTGHPGFTAVGIPTSIVRFAALHSYDNIPPERLPAELR